VVYTGIEAPEALLPKAIQPRTKGDEDKLMIGLHKIIEEDPALGLERNDETHQTILWGMGDAHLDVVIERLKRKFGVDVEEVPFKVPYRSSIRSKTEVLGRHVKQSGGHGQYGIANLRVEPLPRGEGFVFEDKIFGGAIPNQFIPSVEKGVRAAMEQGAGTGFPMIDLKVELYDGKYHSVDSSDMAFQLAGALALKEAAAAAGVVLLEPIVEVDVVVPESHTGDIMGDLNAKRAKIQGVESAGAGKQRVKALVPQAEVARYSIDLRSMTGGRAAFTMHFSHYEEVPSHLADKIIAAAQQEKEEARK
jgi:elongation factor G